VQKVKVAKAEHRREVRAKLAENLKRARAAKTPK